MLSVLPKCPNTDGDASSTISSESDSNCIQIPQQKEKFLLDLYSGCGAMSTGLCMGASLSGIKLIKVYIVPLPHYNFVVFVQDFT